MSPDFRIELRCNKFAAVWVRTCPSSGILENQISFSTLLKNKAGLSNEGVWLGLNRHGSSFRWYDGTSAGYQIWGNGEPNNRGGNENCAQMYKGGGNAGKWNDHQCSGYGAAPSALCQKKVAWHGCTWWRDSHILVRNHGVAFLSA